MLLVFGGLPASGKSTLSKCVARKLQAVYVRVDSIEQALRDEGFNRVYGEGYAVAYQLAADNLLFGSTVVADSVNSISMTRNAWRSVGESIGVPVIEIEIMCSDKAEHRQRVETRVDRIAGLIQPTWDEVIARDYEPWEEACIVIDTAGEEPDASCEKTLALIESILTTL